ncbi:type IV secretion system protein VirB10 [Phenylobacterium sp.]|jgi:type IV secretion system protein VirB10|uniref:type IV secretion system protein VirB10 n=1 Tax=Phenylobacterium sp. TaxID=1871053 RepID=UPI002F3F828C
MTDPQIPPTAPEAAAAIAGERTISPIAGRFGMGKAGKAVAVVALAAGCAAFLLATGRHRPAKAAEPPAPARQVVPFEPAASLAGPTLANPGPGAPSLAPGMPTAAPDPSGAAPATTGRSSNPDAAAAQRAQQLRASRAAPIFAYSRDGTSAPAAGPIVPAILPRGAGAEVSELDRLRRASTLGMAHASRLPDRSYLILAGTSIPCVLQTAMDTSTPGYVSCLVPNDVYSDNGAVVLLEKGTKVLGEYRGGPKPGQNRLFVLWSRAVTPAGVAIALASPATDALGRAGFDGDLDRHFWQRFGGAVMLSVIDDGFAVAARGSGGVNVQLPSTTANTALQSSIDIPPTLKKPAGAEVAIFAAQDFDFSGVYGVKAR